MTLGESINYYRKKAGLSQEELAEKVGVSRQSVSKWELGEATPEVGKLMALAAAFGITTDRLLSGEIPKEEPPAAGPEQKKEMDLEKGAGFLGRLIRRHGWLAGVYIALEGLGVTLVGGLGRYMFSRMFRVSQGMFNSVGGMGGWTFEPSYGFDGGGFGDIDFGGMIAGGTGFGDMGLGQQTTAAMSQMRQIPIIFTTVIMALGLAVTVAGVVLAVVLYRKGRKE